MKVNTLMRCSAIVPTLAAALIVASVAAAQSGYPARPIRLIVPYPPGGPTDLIARSVNEPLGSRLGQPVIVDNRGGAATLIGTELAARAAPDGYTLLVATVTTLAVNPALNRRLPYHPERDFAPISMLGVQPYLLATHPSLPAASITQLVALAKASPGKLTFGSAGVGTGAHLAGEMFRHMAGIQVVHVPYKGTGPAIVDLVAGQISLLFGGISALRPHAVAGKLRVLGVTSPKRSPAVPDVPTIDEAGVRGYATTSWNSLVAPRGVPQPILQRLNAEIVAVLRSPDVSELLRKRGTDPDPGTPAELAAHIRSEIARFNGLVKAIGLKAE
jgi:tripartite-type tricarboxylate transporter receptor subunit TctC